MNKNKRKGYKAEKPKNVEISDMKKRKHGKGSVGSRSSPHPAPCVEMFKMFENLLMGLQSVSLEKREDIWRDP